eukprot:sb/3474757/
MEVDPTPPGRMTLDDFVTGISGVSGIIPAVVESDTVSGMVTDGMKEACAAYSAEELSALTVDCEQLWDDTKCACIAPASSAVEPVPEEEEEDGPKMVRMCDTLFLCIVTTLNQGVRNGGGIGDVLRSPNTSELS